MAYTTFIDFNASTGETGTKIVADWLNDVNDFVYGNAGQPFNSDQFLRSDVSDAFTGQDFYHSNELPRHFWIETGVNTDQSTWGLIADTEAFGGYIYSNDLVHTAQFLGIERSGIGAGITVDSIDLTATTAIDLNCNNVYVKGITPTLRLYDSDAVLDEKYCGFFNSAGVFYGRIWSDSLSTPVTWLELNRTGTTIDSIDLTAANVNLVANTNVTGALSLVNNLPRIWFQESDAGADQSYWRLGADGEVLRGRIYSDDALNSTDFLAVQRSGLGAGITVDSIDLTATDINLNGTLTLNSDYLYITPAGNVNGHLEIGSTTNTTATQPLIDFHSGATAVDYDVRISVTGGSGVSGGGNLNIAANNINLNSIGDLTIIGALDTGVAAVTSALTHVFAETGTDGVIRKITPANFISDLGLGHRGALVFATLQTGILTSTDTIVAFANETEDTDAIHDNATNNSRLTVPTGVSHVKLIGQISWSGSSVGQREAKILKNSGETYAGIPFVIQDALSSGTAMKQTVTTPILAVTSGDYFELEGWQNSGGSLSFLGTQDETWFSMEIID